MKKKIGIVGCGAIGSFMAKGIVRDFGAYARISALCDLEHQKAKAVADSIKKRIPVLSVDRLIGRSDLIIEAASSLSSYDICMQAIEEGKDIIVMSIGGLLGKPDIFKLARDRGAKIILPSGAVCGIDGLKSAGAGKINKVTLTTRKPPRGLKGAPYIIENNIDLDSITDEKVIFEGTAEEAVKAFPKNINVCALLSIAGIGARRTKVRIITSAEYMVNMHEVEVEGDFGKFITRTENMPFPQNPKTSFLAALSALSTLKNYFDSSVQIGT